MIKSRKSTTYVLLLGTLAISLVMHWRVFPLDLMSAHVWRQTETQLVIDNFYEEDFNILNPRINDRGSGDGIVRKEFPLMQWLFALSYKVLGPSITLTRILSFLIGLASLLGMYQLARTYLHSESAGLVAVWMLTFSPAFFYYMVCPLPDNLALSLVTWGFYSYIRCRGKPSVSNMWVPMLLLGLAALVKLPFVLFFALPISDQGLRFLKGSNSRFGIVTVMAVVALVPAAIWYVQAIPSWGANPILSGILRPDLSLASYGHDLWVNLAGVLPELLLNYATVPFFLVGLYFSFARRRNKELFWPVAVLVVCLLGYVLFELPAIGAAHDYYFFPFLPLLFLVSAYGAVSLLRLASGLKRHLVVLAIATSCVVCFLRMQGRWDPDKPGFNKDLLQYKEQLQDAVPSNALCVVGNDNSHHVAFYYLDKKGWAFQDDRLDPERLQMAIAEGAQFLYSDSRKVENAVRSMLGDAIRTAGSYRVFELRMP